MAKIFISLIASKFSSIDYFYLKERMRVRNWLMSKFDRIRIKIIHLLLSYSLKSFREKEKWLFFLTYDNIDKTKLWYLK